MVRLRPRVVRRTRGTKGISIRGTLRHLLLLRSNTSTITVSITITKAKMVVCLSYEAVWLRYAAVVCWRSAASFDDIENGLFLKPLP